MVLIKHAFLIHGTREARLVLIRGHRLRCSRAFTFIMDHGILTFFVIVWYEIVLLVLKIVLVKSLGGAVHYCHVRHWHRDSSLVERDLSIDLFVGGGVPALLT